MTTAVVVGQNNNNRKGSSGSLSGFFGQISEDFSTASTTGSASFAALSSYASLGGSGGGGGGGDDSIRRRGQNHESGNCGISIDNIRSTVTHKEESQKRKLIGLAVEQLAFHRVGLHGRKEELQTMEICLDKILQTNNASHAPPITRVLFLTIEGCSGTGKTRLARSLIPFMKRKNKRSICVSTKFDLQQTSEPYAGIQMIMENICRHILDLPHRRRPQQRRPSSSADHHDNNDKYEYFQDFQELLEKELTTGDMNALIQIAPSLGYVVLNKTTTTTHEDQEPSSSIQRSSMQNKTSLISFKYYVQRFVEVICNAVPLVIVLDDMMWADQLSLDVIQTLLMDIRNNALMIVGCRRTKEEVSSQESESSWQNMEQMITNLRGNSDGRRIIIEEIVLGDLSYEAVDLVVRDVLSWDYHDDCNNELDDDNNSSDRNRDPMHELSTAIYTKCGGNCLFVNQFLIWLVREGALKFSIAEMKWEWNIQDVRRNSLATENVLSLVMGKLETTYRAREVLPIAACLGSIFDVNKIVLVLEEMMMDDNTKEEDIVADEKLTTTTRPRCFIENPTEILDELDVIMEGFDHNGIVEDFGDGLFGFLHDKLLEGSLGFIPEEDLNDLKYFVGKVLQKRLTGADVDESLFLVVNLLNARKQILLANKEEDDDDEGGFQKERNTIGKLNYRAGKRAVAMSAFRSACDYFANAISLLTTDAWESDHNYCCNLYTSAVHASNSCGDYDSLQSYAAEMTSRGECSPVEKAAITESIIEMHIAQKEPNRAVSVGLEALESLGCPLPSGKLSQLWGMLRSLIGIYKLKTKKPKDFDMLSMSTDPAHHAILQILNKLNLAFWLTQKIELMLISTWKSADLSFKSGIAWNGPAAMSLSAHLLANVFGEVSAGLLHAEHIARIAREFNSPGHEARALVIIYPFVFKWVKPYQEIMNVLQRCYKHAMGVGFEYEGLSCMLQYMLIGFCSGYSLQLLLLKELNVYSNQMLDSGELLANEITKIFWQLVLNFTGDSARELDQDCTLLIGSAFNQNDQDNIFTDGEKEMTACFTLCLRLILCAFFGEYIVGADLSVKESSRVNTTLAGQVCLDLAIFSQSLCCFVASKKASKGRRRQYTKHARKMRKVISAWVKKGSPNLVGHLHLLNAERDLLKGQHNTAAESYEKAILSFGRQGFINLQALANERLADLFLDLGRSQEADYRLERSKELLLEWGAREKYRLLCAQHSSTLTLDL